MPIQDTGLDVYESAMRPVRQNVQAIFAHQAKQKANAESERRQIELEQRAEAGAIRTEGRRKTEEDADAMATAVAAAGRYGLPTENRTPEQLQQDVEKEVAKKVPRDFLMANMDVLPGILDQEKISAIQNNTLSEGELAQIKANVEGSIQTSRASDAELWRRQSPVYLEDRSNAEGMLVNIAEQRAAVFGAPLGDAARRAIAAAFPQDDSTTSNEKWLEYRKKAAMRTVEDPDIQDMLSADGSYNRLRANFAQNPGLVILGHSPINSNGDKLDSMDDEDKMLLMEAWARGQNAQSSHANQKEESDYWRAERSLKAAHEAQNPMSQELAELKKEEFAIYKKFPELHGWNSQMKKVMPKVKEVKPPTDSSSDGDSSGFGGALERLQETPNPAPMPDDLQEVIGQEVVGQEVVGQNPDGTNIVATTSRGPALNQEQMLNREQMFEEAQRLYEEGSKSGGDPNKLVKATELFNAYIQGSAPPAPLTAPAPSPSTPPINAAASALGPGFAPPKASPEMFSPEWEAEYKREQDNSYYKKKLNETNAKIADMESRSEGRNPSSAFAWYDKAKEDKTMFENLVKSTESKQAQPYGVFPADPIYPAPVLPAPTEAVPTEPPPANPAWQEHIDELNRQLRVSGVGSVPYRSGDDTGYAREMQRIRDSMGPSVQGQLGQSPTGWEMGLHGYGQMEPPLYDMPWAAEYRRGQLPAPQQRTLPTQPTWQTY